MIWFAIIISGLFTFLTRFSFIGGLAGRPLPATVRALLGYVTTAVLTAIIASEVLVINDHFTIANNPQIPAFLLAAIIALIFRNIVLTIATGLLALWICQHMIY
jgi:branched-subunit amino acid transport protein